MTERCIICCRGRKDNVRSIHQFPTNNIPILKQWINIIQKFVNLNLPTNVLNDSAQLIKSHFTRIKICTGCFPKNSVTIMDRSYVGFNPERTELKKRMESSLYVTTTYYFRLHRNAIPDIELVKADFLERCQNVKRRDTSKLFQPKREKEQDNCSAYKKRKNDDYLPLYVAGPKNHTQTSRFSANGYGRAVELPSKSIALNTCSYKPTVSSLRTSIASTSSGYSGLPYGTADIKPFTFLLPPSVTSTSSGYSGPPYGTEDIKPFPFLLPASVASTSSGNSGPPYGTEDIKSEIPSPKASNITQCTSNNISSISSLASTSLANTSLASTSLASTSLASTSYGPLLSTNEKIPKSSDVENIININSNSAEPDLTPTPNPNSNCENFWNKDATFNQLIKEAEEINKSQILDYVDFEDFSNMQF